MFCEKCGSPVSEGSGFCPNCGASLAKAQPPASSYAPPAAPQPTPDRKRTGGGSFFSSPAGIVLIVLLGILIAGGAVTGIIFGVRGCSGTNYEEELANAWDEYEEIVDEADEEIGTIDLNSAKLESALEKSQDEIEKIQKKVEALEDLIKKLNPPDDKWKQKNDQFAGSVKYYKRYLEKLDELYATVLSGNVEAQVTKLENIFVDMIEAAEKSIEFAEGFLDDNTAVTGAVFDPKIFDIPQEIADQADGAVTDDTTTDDVTASDTASARLVMDEVLALYLQGGWDAITGYMTPELYDAYINAPVPWSQVSYVVISANVISQTTIDGNTEAFGVVEEQDDFGEIYSATFEWQLVRSGGTWRVCNVIDEYGGSLI